LNENEALSVDGPVADPSQYGHRPPEPFFSVVIPVYNRESLIVPALRSVLRQRFTDFEIIVVDDGSTDQTATRVREAAPTARLIRQENSGGGVARNRGAREARGRYLAFLDSDDEYFPWTLDVFHRVVTGAHAPKFVTGPYTTNPHPIECNDPTQALARLAVTECQSFFESARRRPKGFLTSGMAVDRDAFLATPGFPEDPRATYQDGWASLQLGIVPGYCHIDFPPVAFRKIHDSNISGNAQTSIRGVHRLIDTELAGGFPGDQRLAMNRKAIITSHVRSAAVSYARMGLTRDAWRLYRRTFGWNLRLRRFKFLLAMPVLAARGSRNHARRPDSPS